MREGFYLVVEHANTCIPEKQRMTESLDALTADTLRVIYQCQECYGGHILYVLYHNSHIHSSKHP
jgi:hypothetical protein